MYYQESFKPEGHELSDEIRYLQAKKTLNMMINFLKAKNFLYQLESNQLNMKYCS